MRKKTYMHVWYKDGTSCSCPQHHALLITATTTFCLILALPYTLVLLFDLLIEKCFTRFRWFRFVDAYHAWPLQGQVSVSDWFVAPGSLNDIHIGVFIYHLSASLVSYSLYHHKQCTDTLHHDHYASVGGAPEAYGSRRVCVCLYVCLSRAFLCNG